MILGSGKTMIGRYVITLHAVQRYEGRVIKDKSHSDNVIKSIRMDLRTLNIKNIVHKEKNIHIFTKGYKEFIFKKTAKGLVLSTVIKRNMDDTRKTVYKRKVKK